MLYLCEVTLLVRPIVFGVYFILIMTQIVVTLENGADSSLLQRMIENMKGVLNVSVRSKKDDADVYDSTFVDKLRAIKSQIDPEQIDLSDDRTQYIMSK